MRHIVTGLIAKPIDAQKIIDDLLSQCLCDRADISILAGESASQPGGVFSQAARGAGQLAAAAGAAASTALGGVLGFGSSLVSRQVSGFGVLTAAGELGAKLSRAALDGAQDLARTFADMGMQAELTREYADALRGGSILIVVDAKTDNMAQCVRKVLNAHSAASPAERAAH